MLKDEEKLVVYDLKNKLIWGIRVRYAVLVLSLFFLVISILIGNYSKPMVALILPFAAYNIIGHLVYHKKKQYQPWEILSLTGLLQIMDVIVITYLIYFTGWLESPYWFLYLILIVISGFGIFSQYSVIVFLIALFSAVFYLGLLMAAYYGIIPMYGLNFSIPPIELLHSIINRAIFTLVTFFLFASTIYYFSKMLTQNQDALNQKNKELLATLDELKEIDRMKNEFISNASHELRTPLSVIRENISLLSDGVTGEINERQKGLLVTSLGNVDHLAKILNDLMDVSKIKSHSLELNRQQAKISYLATEAMALLRDKAEKKEIKIESRLAPRARTLADSNQVLRVFINLLDNAIKFTPEKGNILVVVEETSNEILAYIEDNGIGIAEKELALMFERFTRLSNTPEKGKGSGLGLSICKGIVEMHNGRIWAESKLGTGTKISFTLPKIEGNEYA